MLCCVTILIHLRVREREHVGCSKIYECALCTSAISTYEYVCMLSSWRIHVLWWSFSQSPWHPLLRSHITVSYVSVFYPCSSLLLFFLFLFLLTVPFNSSMYLHFQPLFFLFSPAKLRLFLETIFYNIILRECCYVFNDISFL